MKFLLLFSFFFSSSSSIFFFGGGGGELETLYYNRLVSRVRLIRKYRFDVPSARPFIRESARVERQGERKNAPFSQSAVDIYFVK